LITKGVELVLGTLFSYKGQTEMKNSQTPQQRCGVSAAVYTGFWSLLFGFPETLQDTCNEWLPLRRLTNCDQARYFERAWDIPMISRVLFSNTMISPPAATEIVHTLGEQREGVILELNPKVFAVLGWQEQVVCPICYDPAHAFWEVAEQDRHKVSSFVRDLARQGRLAVIHVQCDRSGPEDLQNFLKGMGKTFDLLRILSNYEEFTGDVVIENNAFHACSGRFRMLRAFFATRKRHRAIVDASLAIVRPLFQR
jgi:hypothetical protein